MRGWWVMRAMVRLRICFKDGNFADEALVQLIPSY